MSDFFTATDARRATALLAHAARGDIPGMRAVLAEADADGTALELAAAATVTALDLRPDLRSEAGVQALNDLTAALAAEEAGPGTEGSFR